MNAYEVPEYIGPVLREIKAFLQEMYLKKLKREFSEYDENPDLPFTWNGYYWLEEGDYGFDPVKSERPNISFNGVNIWYYKHLGRETVSDVEMTFQEWWKWCNDLYKVVVQHTDELKEENDG